MDLIIINMIGAVINSIFLMLYMYVKCSINQHSQYMLMILISLPMIYLSHSSALSVDSTGLFATTLSILMYGLTLDTVSDTLKTRDGKTVNLGITAACIVNGLIWFFYSLLVKDIYLCIPQVVCIVSAFINFELYQWTQGKLDNTHWLIQILQR